MNDIITRTFISVLCICAWKFTGAGNTFNYVQLKIKYPYCNWEVRLIDNNFKLTK